MKHDNKSFVFDKNNKDTALFMINIVFHFIFLNLILSFIHNIFTTGYILLAPEPILITTLNTDFFRNFLSNPTINIYFVQMLSFILSILMLLAFCVIVFLFLYYIETFFAEYITFCVKSPVILIILIIVIPFFFIINNVLGFSLNMILSRKHGIDGLSSYYVLQQYSYYFFIFLRYILGALIAIIFLTRNSSEKLSAENE